MCGVTAIEEPTTAFVRPDGREKVTGAGRYTADLTFTGQLHAAFRYADHPHARITRIDTTRARALPGVIAVVTHEDVPDVLYGGMVKDRRLFARDTVRFEGDIVAGVAATNEAIAREAAALVEVDLEPLPVVSDFEAALEPTRPRVHPDWESYEGDEALGRHDNVLGFSTIVKGDVDAALAASDVVVRGRYVTDPVQGVPIEPRAIVAQWQGDRVTVWSSTQVPYAARAGVAETLAIPESDVRVIVPLLGGGFGAKCDFHFEGHVAALARAAGRPVKLVFSRHEEFVAVGHRREGMVIELETGARSDGTILARRARLVLDGGAYCGEGGFFAQMAAMHAHGPYELGSVDIESSLVYSNNQPSSSIRAPTAPQVCWALEQHMDELAEALGVDPVELRRRTLVEDGSVTATGQVLERIAMKETLERGVELIGAGDDLPENEAIGVACGWWPCFAAHAGAYVRLNPDGTGTILTGAQENGTGAVMAMPRLVAEELGMSPESFSLLYQDTDAAPWDMGSCGSQTTFNSVRAVLAATDDLRDQLLDAASEELEAARDDLELVGGSVRVKGSADKAVTIAALAADGHVPREGRRRRCRRRRPPRRRGASAASGTSRSTRRSSSPMRRTSGSTARRASSACSASPPSHDCGRILNRLGADGQVYGGVVMGIGQALSEGTQLDELGRQRNPHLLDYKLVTASDAPAIDIAWIETDTPNAGPKGSKGVGEPPCVPTAGAIANAISKVIGARVRQLPMTPERVWEA